MKKTYLIVVSPDSELTPKALFYNMARVGLPVAIKETCFGILVEGEKEEVEIAIKKAMELDSNKIFVKERGYPIWDSRICRMKQKGGPRPGFLQLEAEYGILPIVSEAVREAKPEIKPQAKRKRIMPSEIVEVIEHGRKRKQPTGTKTERNL